MSAVEYRFDDYEDFEASALARLAIDDEEEDGADALRDNETAALNCSRLEDYDPAFEEIYNLTTPTEEDCPPVVVDKPHKTTARRTKGLLRRISHRSNGASERSNGDASSSVASGRSRRSLRSIRSTHSCKTLRPSAAAAAFADAQATTPQRGVGRSQSYNVRNSSPTTPSGKKRGVLHKLHLGPRRGQSYKSSNTKETFPEEQSIDEARCPSTCTDDDSSNVLRQHDCGDDSDSDSSVYYDDFSSSSDNNDEGEATESSMDLQHAVTQGPPVFLVETGQQTSFHTSDLHVSLADLTNVSVPEEEEDEEENH